MIRHMYKREHIFISVLNIFTKYFVGPAFIVTRIKIFVPVAKEILSSFEITSREMNRADCNTVRDFLIASLTIDNAPQSSVLASVTINALRKAERKVNTMQVTILDHRTFESSGQPNLCMQLETYRFLDTFVQKIRKQS